MANLKRDLIVERTSEGCERTIERGQRFARPPPLPANQRAQAKAMLGEGRRQRGSLGSAMNKVEAAYRRGDLLDKRRKLMESWQTFCERSTGNVVAMPQAGSSYGGTWVMTV